MLYVRGNKEDFDIWEKQGALGWSYNKILKYFKRSEGCLVAKDQIDAVYAHDSKYVKK
jgi:choline dehydrogenase-like flavoprotein